MNESQVGLEEARMEALWEDRRAAWGGTVWLHPPGLSGGAFLRVRRLDLCGDWIRCGGLALRNRVEVQSRYREQCYSHATSRAIGMEFANRIWMSRFDSFFNNGTVGVRTGEDPGRYALFLTHRFVESRNLLQSNWGLERHFFAQGDLCQRQDSQMNGLNLANTLTKQQDSKSTRRNDIF